MSKNGLVCIYILEILKRYASYKCRLSQNQIRYYLEAEYSLSISRNTLSEYVAALRECGYIEGQRGVFKVNEFDDHELRVLIDGVEFSQYMPQVDAEKLVNKLKKLSYKSLSNRMKHICYVQDLNRTQNPRLYDIIDIIDEAIESDCQIELTYCSYGVDGKLHNREVKVVNPYYIVADKSKYYLICYAGRDGELEPRRLDRIADAYKLSRPRVHIKDIPKYSQGFNLAEYMREHIYMFSGESVYVTLKVKVKNIGDFIDWFGTRYRVVKQVDDYVIVRIKAVENAVYYWALQYGGIAEVLEPMSLRTRLRDGLKEMLERYSE